VAYRLAFRSSCPLARLLLDESPLNHIMARFADVRRDGETPGVEESAGIL
jgi:hypothetical protein